MITTHRRALLRWFGALPFLGGRRADPSPRFLPRGTVVADPEQAERLEDLLDAYRATWEPDAQARRHFERTLDHPGHKSPENTAAFHDHCEARHRRERAHYEIDKAVLEIADPPDLSEDEWSRYGLPWAIVATPDHVFVVLPTDQSEYWEGDVRQGMTDLVILER